MISKTPEDYQYYEDRLKFLRDEEAKLSDAKEEGRQEGHREGHQEGLELGILAGKIQLLQELLGEPVTPKGELLVMSFDVLTTQLAHFQQRLRDRPV